MKNIISIAFSLLFIKEITAYNFQFLSSELLVLPLSPYNFSFPLNTGLHYQPNLLGLPDLPSWLHYTYSSSVNLGYVYGTPPSVNNDIKLEVIATDIVQYNFSRRIYNLNILDDPDKKYEIQLKISNLDVSDILIGDRLSKLEGIIVENLWPRSRVDGAVTNLVKASEMGDRLPLRPTDKEGLYVYYGSNTPFSYELNELEIEVKPLWNHRPCPKYFKKASYERFFRQERFSVDWCSFKLVVTRSYILDIINTLLIPLLVMVVLLGFLTLAMCCHRTNMDIQSSVFFDEIFDDFPRVPNISEIQMVNYMGINKESLTPKSRKSTRGSPHPSLNTTATHNETIPRSRTTSPASTLTRNTPSRKFEDYETLTRPEPPPYHRDMEIL